MRTKRPSKNSNINLQRRDTLVKTQGFFWGRFTVTGWSPAGSLGGEVRFLITGCILGLISPPKSGYGLGLKEELKLGLEVGFDPKIQQICASQKHTEKPMCVSCVCVVCMVLTWPLWCHPARPACPRYRFHLNVRWGWPLRTRPTRMDRGHRTVSAITHINSWYKNWWNTQESH